MKPTDDASTAHDCAEAMALSRLLDADDLDAAVIAGLMDFEPCPSCDQQSTMNVLAFQQRLAKSWAARDRYLARTARLARLAAERDAKRDGIRIENKTSLPPSVAAILARAKAKAAERGT
jgi:hypothetical protein